MVTLRKVTLVAVLVASLAVLAMAIYLFWDLGSGKPILGRSRLATSSFW